MHYSYQEHRKFKELTERSSEKYPAVDALTQTMLKRKEEGLPYYDVTDNSKARQCCLNTLGFCSGSTGSYSRELSSNKSYWMSASELKGWDLSDKTSDDPYVTVEGLVTSKSGKIEMVNVGDGDLYVPVINSFTDWAPRPST